MISVTAPGFTFVNVNAAFCSLTGRSREEFAGGEHAVLFDPADPEVAAFLGEVVAGCPAHVITKLSAHDSQPLRVLAEARRLAGADSDPLALLTLTRVTEPREVADENREAAEYLAGVIRGLPGFVFRRLVRPDGTVEHYAPEWVLDPDSQRPTSTRFDPLRHVHPEDHDQYREVLEQSIRERAPFHAEYRIVRENGVRWYRVRAAMREENEKLVWDGVGVDVTEQKEHESRLQSIEENIPGFLFQRIVYANGLVEYPYVSPKLGRMLGFDSDVSATPGMFWDLIHPDDRTMVRAAIERSIHELSPTAIEFRLVGADNEDRWIRSHATPRRLPGGAFAWDGIAVEVTAEKNAALRLDYLNHYDPLTGLANRARLAEQIAGEVADVRARGGSLALATIVLSGLSEINETLGANDGDIALKGAAARLTELAVGAGTLAARTGGNELAIVRRDADPVETDGFVDTLMRALSRPIPVGGELVMMEPCIGTAFFTQGEFDGLDAAGVGVELMKRSSMALSSAQRSGPGSRATYSTNIDHRAHHRMQLRHAMHRAIEADEFALHYQPMVDLRTGGIVGAEALIRWSHPDFGMLRPDVFIPLAEQSGIIIAMGEWVLRRALGQLRQWHDLGHVALRMAVNVSAIQIRTPGFAPLLRRVMAETGVPARAVEIEITEGVLLESSLEALECLKAVQAQGVSIAIDDFGAGHASFQYLRNFPISKLKIDQMFVRQLVINSSDALIVQAIATLARSLSLDLVAEGIETTEQRDFLREHGCRTGQGYLFSLPLEAEDFGWMLTSKPTLPVLSPRTPNAQTHALQG